MHAIPKFRTRKNQIPGRGATRTKPGRGATRTLRQKPRGKQSKTKVLTN